MLVSWLPPGLGFLPLLRQPFRALGLGASLGLAIGLAVLVRELAC